MLLHISNIVSLVIELSGVDVNQADEMKSPKEISIAEKMVEPMTNLVQQEAISEDQLQLINSYNDSESLLEEDDIEDSEDEEFLD